MCQQLNIIDWGGEEPLEMAMIWQGNSGAALETKSFLKCINQRAQKCNITYLCLRIAFPDFMMIFET